MEITTQIDNFTIHPATAADVPLLLAFIKELAEYEKLAHQVTATEPLLRETLFGPRPAAEAVIGIYDGEPVCFALFFHNFSTFLGQPGLYLEDLYVRPSVRGKGLGRTMLAYLAYVARQRNCGRFEWSVLDWNEAAIRVYRGIGASAMEDWTIYRLTGPALNQLADQF
jgi:GNAT superfamily N-acetyltransferase